MRYRLLVLTTSFLCLSGNALYANDAENKTVDNDLSHVYQISSEQNATFKSAYATFKANEENIPINRGALLPNVTLSDQLQYNYANQPTAGQKQWYYSNMPQAQLTQVIFDFGLWNTYTQAQFQTKADAITFDQARQTLVTSVSQAYFNILQAEDNLKFAQSSQNWNHELLKQTQQKYDVGLAAITDVQSTKAQYEQAVAQTVSAQNSLDNAYESLAQITGVQMRNIVPLKTDFPFVKPKPDNINAWLNVAMKNNLTVVQNQFLVDVAKKQVNIDWGAFLPSASLQATSNSTANYQSVPSSTTYTNNIGITGTWVLLNGGTDYSTVKQDKFNLKAAEYNLLQSQRDTESNLRQAYLSVIADISQVKAFEQSVISNESSLKAMRAQYNVGTSTIVDLLNQQQQLLNAQQQYAQAKYQYINDILNLKLQAGTLAPQDLNSINKWLGFNDTKNESEATKALTGGDYTPTNAELKQEEQQDSAVTTPSPAKNLKQSNSNEAKIICVSHAALNS